MTVAAASIAVVVIYKIVQADKCGHKLVTVTTKNASLLSSPPPKKKCMCICRQDWCKHARRARFGPLTSVWPLNLSINSIFNKPLG